MRARVNNESNEMRQIEKKQEKSQEIDVDMTAVRKLRQENLVQK